MTRANPDYSARVTTPQVTVDDALTALDALYPPQTAEEWDNVGLTCGDRSAPLRRVLFAIDPLPEVVAEAVAWDADLLVTHHPLLLLPAYSVSGDTWKGRALQSLIRADCALFTAHTNADVAVGGVNDALAAALGLQDAVPLQAATASDTGLGRVGTVAAPTTVRGFAEAVVAALPSTPAGIRCYGDPDRLVTTVAVCGGAGDSLLAVAGPSGADVYVTADLRHHRVTEHLAEGGPPLIDAGHWATEWPWLPVASAALHEALTARGVDATTVETRVSTTVTEATTVAMTP